MRTPVFNNVRSHPRCESSALGGKALAFFVGCALLLTRILIAIQTRKETG